MAKKTKQNIKEVTVSLAIKKAGGAYQFWRKLAEAAGADEFLIRYEKKVGFVERAIANKTVGHWVGGEKAWHESDNPMGLGYIGGQFIVGRDKNGIVASSSLVGK